MTNVTLYYTKNDPACQQAIQDIKDLGPEFDIHLILIDIDQNDYLKQKMGQGIPIIEIGPYLRASPFTKQDILIMVQASKDRLRQLEQLNRVPKESKPNPTGDKITNWISHHFMALFISVTLLYSGIPFLAPVFLKYGMEKPAQVIYTIYSPMCHQLAFRSWFLFGQQAYYPRQIAQVNGILSYESEINPDSLDLVFARNFEGDPKVGFKVALCQRDIAMYGSFGLFGIIFVISGRRFSPLPWYYWIILALIPIGFDGISQLPGLAQGLPDWLPIRESNPLLRVLTGFSFGFFTGWYLFPLVEQSMQETRVLLQRKSAAINKAVKE